MPPSHAFGGIIGDVALEIQAPVAVTDLYIQNLPEITTVNATLEIDNRSGLPAKRDIEVSVADCSDPTNIVFETTLRDYVVPPGRHSIPVRIDIRKQRNGV